MDLMTTQEVADYIRTPAATLRYWRHTGTGPKGFKLGGRRVMYRRQDVDSWIEAQYEADDAEATA